MSLTVRPLSHALGAEIAGVDLAKPLSNAEFDQIHHTFLEKGILLFRDQEITREQHIAVIPFAAGGTTDLLACALGQHMTQAWGQPVVADNRAGANGEQDRRRGGARRRDGGRQVRVAQQGGDMVASAPAEFAAFIETERRRYETIVREAGMTVD
jgi:tripartite-type tricarboxylate transporter receptor subunit TctC